MVLGLFGGLVLARAGSPESISYWVQPCSEAEAEAVCRSGDSQLADWSLEAWQNASGGVVRFQQAGNRAQARIRILWATAEQGLYGEARRIVVDGKPGAEVYVLPAPMPVNEDAILRDAIVYLTCLHETGHALGLAHTAAFDDIMYSFQYGGDIPEYFARYRRRLNERRDIHNNSGLSEADRRHLLAALAK